MMMETVGPIKQPEARAGLESPRLRQTFVVGENGLHARPCALLIKTLQCFGSSVEVEAHGVKASARSILSLLALGVGPGAQVAVCVSGEDAAQAMAAVRRLFDTGFQEAYRPAVLRPRYANSAKTAVCAGGR